MKGKGRYTGPKIGSGVPVRNEFMYPAERVKYMDPVDAYLHYLGDIDEAWAMNKEVDRMLDCEDCEIQEGTTFPCSAHMPTAEAPQ